MLWLEHISPEQLQMGIAVCSLLTVMLLIVTLHKINRIQRYIQKKQTGTDRMESAEFGSAFPADCMQFMFVKRIPMNGPEIM